MDLTIDDLKEAGFTDDTWPEALPTPGTDTISQRDRDGTKRRYRFEVTVDGNDYGMEVDLDTANVPDPAEGISFMLNQFAFLWRSDKSQIEVEDDGSVRRINF